MSRRAKSSTISLDKAAIILLIAACWAPLIGVMIGIGFALWTRLA